MAATAEATDADADIGCVGWLQTGLGHQVHHEKIGRGARRSHSDLHALEVGGGSVACGLLLAHAHRDAGKAAELDHRRDVLALGLHADGVLVGAGDHIDRAADQRLQRLRAAAKIVDRHFKPLLLEIAEPLANGQRRDNRGRLCRRPRA